jgi:CDP-diacylglycerol--serine O-phosphatidyltransferase
MILCLSAGYPPTSWHRWSWFFSLAYFLGALLRLARFTAESVPDESAHVAFKGLPSPGAAGCVASLVLFYSYLGEWKAFELRWLSEHVIDSRTVQGVAQASLPVFLPLLGLVLGFTMVSNRLRFVHFGTWFFHRRHSFDFLAYLIFGGILVALVPEVVLPILFCGYLAYTPALYVVHYFLPRKAAATPVPDEWKPS